MQDPTNSFMKTAHLSSRINQADSTLTEESTELSSTTLEATKHTEREIFSRNIQGQSAFAVEDSRSFAGQTRRPHDGTPPDVLGPIALEGNIIAGKWPSTNPVSSSVNNNPPNHVSTITLNQRSAESWRSFLDPEVHPSLQLDSRISSGYSSSERSFLEPKRAFLKQNIPTPNNGSSELEDGILPHQSAISESGSHRSFCEPYLTDAQYSFPSLTSVPPRIYTFTECNSMLRLSKSVRDMNQYLRHREGWTMVVTKGHGAKTVRFPYIAERMDNKISGENFILIKPSYVEQFLSTYCWSKRKIELNNNRLRITDEKSNKRIKRS
ncbi:hypothetical protein F5884DRAFT_148922 [Xylogone sp. PMI_703]|nr:hypothetical protein F5884DRAFT_148922 [Xylogone sp. PMI_703]